MNEKSMKELFKGAAIVDFTAAVPGALKMDGFGKPFVEMVRDSNAKTKAVVLIDKGLAGKDTKPIVVKDHVNLSGNNPLVGPNDPCGQRFPIVQGIYFEDALEGWPKAVLAGLKQGEKPNTDELAALEKIGVGVCSYNIVPSMLVAAHAGWKVLGIVVPDSGKLSEEQLKQIRKVVEE